MTRHIGSVFSVEVRRTLEPKHDDLTSMYAQTYDPLGGWSDGDTGVSSARGVTTPFEKVGVHDSTMAPLEDDAVETFRSGVMRLGFSACDRLDVQRAAKEAVRGTVKPSGRHPRILCRLVRYLIHSPTLTWRWYKQRWSGRIVVDWR